MISSPAIFAQEPKLLIPWISTDRGCFYEFSDQFTRKSPQNRHAWTTKNLLIRLSVESGGFSSSDGEIEFAKEEQDPRAKGRERPQPPRIRDDPGNQ